MIKSFTTPAGKAFLLFGLMLMSLAVSAQQTLTVYDGTKTSEYIPINYDDVYHNSIKAQHVIPADALEILDGNTIQGLKYYSPYTSGCTAASTIQFYLKEVDYTTITSFEDKSTATVVYTGTVTIGTDGIATIMFDNPYTYNGGNLLVGAENLTSEGGYIYTIYFYGQQVTGSAIWARSPFTTIKTEYFIPKTTFIYELNTTCPKPKNLSASNITANSATVQWTPQGEEDSWSVQYRVANMNANWIDKGIVTSSTCELDNLASYTEYEFRVRPECTEGANWTRTATFRTLWTMVTVDEANPYSTDFEGDACDWYFINGTQTNKWVWGSATQNGGSKSLYVSNDFGTSNQYTLSTKSTTYAIKAFHLSSGYHAVSFDWKNDGENNCDYLRVALAPATATLTAGTTPMNYFYSNVPSGWIALDGGSQLNKNNVWQSQSLEFNLSSGGDYMVVLAWVNDGSSGNQPPAAIDNFSISYVTCPKPKNLTLLWANVDRATFMWTAVGSTNTWNMQYKQADATTWTNVNATITNHNYILTGLEPNTAYQVRVQSGCGSAWTEPVSFTTLCEPLEVTTFSERFTSLSSLNLIPECWSLDGTLTNESRQWKYTNSGHNGNGVYFTASSPSGETTALKTPIMNLPAGEPMQLSFWYKNDGGANFSIYISTDRGKTYTTALASSLPAASGWTEKAIVLPDQYIGAEDVVLVFVGTTGTSWNYVFLDDVIVGPVTTCPKPQDLHVTTLTESTATLQWTPGGTENTWEIAYSIDPDFDPDFQGAHVTATTNPFTVTGLHSGVTYYAYVRAKCSAVETSQWCNDVCSFYPVMELTVNDGTTTNQYVPVELEYLKTVGDKSQFIIPAATLTDLKNSQINKLTFYCSTSSAYFQNAKFKVYMTEADQTTYGDFYPSGSMTTVYSGTFSVSNNKLEITLDAPYNYFGGNLIIGIYESSKGSNNGSNVNWYGVSTSSNTAIYKYISGYLTGRAAFLPKTTFAYAPFTCPFDLTASNISAEGATLSWHPMGNETHWDVFYTENPDYVPAANTPAQFSNIGTNPFVMTGVEPGRTYYVYVRANNGADGVSEWSVPCSFMLASLLTVNDGSATNNYVPVPGWYVDLPFSGEFVIPAEDLQAMANTEIRQMTFYTTSPFIIDWGELNYNLYLQEVDFAEFNRFHSHPGQPSFSGVVSVSDYQMTLNLDQPYYYRGGNLLVSFQSEHNGAVNKVNPYWAGVVTENTENHWSSAIQYRESSWFNIHSGGMSFLPKTTFSYVVPEVVPQYCESPTNVEVSGITTNSAIISWTSNGNGQQWEMQYKKADESDFINVQGEVTNPYTLQELEPSHGYWVRVRAVCGDDFYSDWVETWFSTECVPITSLPYSYGFEDMKYNAFPPCWSYNSSNEDVPWVESYSSHAGYYALVMMGSQTGDLQFAILPPIPVDAQHPMSGNELVFYGAMYNDASSVQVGIMTDPTDPETFTLVEELELPVDFTYRKYQVSFANYTGDGTYIAIRKANTSDEYSYLFIDDVLVRPIPSCLEPTALTVSNVAQTTATLQWTVGGSETSWQVQYKLADESYNGLYYEWPETYQTVSQSTCALGTLTQGTSYEARVRAACSDTETSDWSEPVGFTTTTLYTAPFFEDFGVFPSNIWLAGWGSANALLDEVLTGTALEIETCGTWGTGYCTNRSFTNADNGVTYYSDGVFYNDASGVTNHWDITPDIALDEGWQLNFDMALIYQEDATSGLDDNRFAVLITDDNGTSWTTLGLWDHDGTAGRFYYDIPCYLSEVSFDLSAYNNKTVRIAFYIESTVENPESSGNLVGNAIYLDKVNVTKQVKPGDVVLSDITPTSAVVDWTSHGETSCTLQYRKFGDEEWSTITTTERPYTIAELSTSFDYMLRMKANYSTGESEWSELVLFNSGCATLHLGPDETYEQTFYTPTNYYSMIPACWSTSGDRAWSISNGTARASHASNTSYSYGYLITPDIYVTPGLTLVFNHSTELNSLAYAEVRVYVEGYYYYSVWNSDVDDLSSRTTTISLGNFVGQTVDIRFYYEATINANYGTASSFSIYDVSFYNRNTFTKQTDDGYWTETDNWSKGMLPEATESVTIDGPAVVPNGCVAQANEINLTSKGSLTLADGSQLKHHNEGVEAKVWKAITPYTIAINNGEDKPNGWCLIASPMQTAVIPSENMVSNNFDLYRFNQSNELEWENYQQYFYLSPYFKLNNGQGYLYANSGDGYNPTVMIDMEGQLQPSGENVEVPLTYDASSEFQGFNLVGNPFACDAYLTEERDFYVMNTAGDELEINSSANGVIAPLQGLFVAAANADDQAVTFTSTMPDGQKRREALSLVLSGGVTNHSGSTILDRARVRFGEGPTLRKFSLKPNGSKLYLTQDQKDYAVLYAERKGEVPVSFKAVQNGNYTLTVNPEEVEVRYLHLIDHLTGADVDLLQTPSYTFEARTTDYRSRFKLVFSANENGNDNGNENFAFINNGEIIVETPWYDVSTIQVIDMLGRVILTRTVTPHSSLPTPNSPGVYVLRLISGNDVKTQKIVIE